MKRTIHFCVSLLFIVISFSVALEHVFHVVRIQPLGDPVYCNLDENFIFKLFYDNNNARKSLEKCFDGSYDMRGLFVRAWNSVSVYLFSNHANVYIGKNGWCFFESYITKCLNDCRCLELNNVKMLKRFDDFESFLEQNDIDCIVLIPPYKTRIYADEFSGLPPELTQESTMNKLLSTYSFKKKRIHFINIYKELLARKDWGQLYYKGDIHWTYLAGFIADDLLMNKIADITNTNVSGLGYAASMLEKVPLGAEHFFMQGLSPLEEYVWKYSHLRTVKKKGLRDSRFWSYTNTNSDQDIFPSLVVVGDSYYRYFMDNDLISEYFKSTQYYLNDLNPVLNFTVPSDTKFIVLEFFENNASVLTTDAWWDNFFKLLNSINRTHAN